MSSLKSTKPPNYSVQKIIEMFADLGLDVCDDGPDIQAKVDAQRARRLRDSQNPTEAVREGAKRWFQNVEAMQNRRSELLAVVYQHYVTSADTALSAALANGVTTLTPRLQKDLVSLARTACCVCDRLAARFVENYRRDRGLTDDGSLVPPPRLVENFSAAAGMGQVRLTWTCPQEHFDEVEISREELPEKLHAGGTRTAEIVYRGTGASFVDQALSPGAAYLYRAYSWFSGVKRADSRAARSVCIAEVSGATARWTGTGVELSWRLSRSDASVLVFKRQDREPELTFTPRGVMPAEETLPVVQGPLTTCFDERVGEGESWFYRIVCDFGEHRLTPGVAVGIRIPVSPPPPRTLTGVYQQEGEQAAVALEWKPSTSAPLEYVVVRREGAAPPGRVEEGIVVATTPGTRHRDENIVNGRRYSYAVFSRAGESSRTAAVAPPVDATADVTNLQAESGDGTVQLQWTTPVNVSRVVVRRSMSIPSDHRDGAPVSLLAAGRLKDEYLHNGRQYHYLVCCVYRPDGKTDVFSPGVRITVVPERLPEMVNSFSVQSENHKVRCSWSLPKHGQVVVLRSAKPLPVPVGHQLAADQLRSHGSFVPADGAGKAVDPQPDLREPYYSVVTVAGGRAVLGLTKTCAICRDVSRLQHRITKSGISLRWEWPKECNSCVVARRHGDWPSGPEDEHSVRRLCSRAEYDAAGQQFVDAIDGMPGHYHYVVYAVATSAGRRFHALGASAECKVKALWAPWMTIEYSLAPAAKDQGRGQAVNLAWRVDRPLSDFGGFALVADRSEIPSNPAHGVELFRWTPHNGQLVGLHQAQINLEPIRQRGWPWFFAKLMTLDPAQGACTFIVHPNVCIPWSDRGQALRQKAARRAPRYSPKVPRTVICPKCFEEFPLGRMLFDSYKGGEARPANYGFLDRLLRRPPVPPQNQQGSRLPSKLCPNRHRLPYTAGVQGNLVIGIIGAKFSGKSHYVASLISRLENQTGSDLHASLVHVTDETPVRYKNEFHAPLFERQVELPVTVGEPEPLIYCLTIDAPAASNKSMASVTLALYDTAGENFNNPDLVRRMVRYLRVASGVIFLIDPLQIPAVRDLLPRDVSLPHSELQAQPNEIVGRVLQELEEGMVLHKAQALSIPVAVALTKCDVLRDAELFLANRLWSADHRHIGFFDDQAHDDMCGMIGEKVRQWDRAVFNTVTQRFSNYAFFGVSATGCASNKTSRRYAYVSPWRVEDPLLWLLAELGVIPRRPSAARFYS